MTQSTRERSLTPPEVQDRTAVLLHLLDEQDTIRFRVRASRDELREWRVEARNLAARIDQVRQEIRSGVVVESAQPELPHMENPGNTLSRFVGAVLTPAQHAGIGAGGGDEDGIDGSSDEPDPETDPPPPEADRYRMFDMNYPKAQDYPTLLDSLHEALGQVVYDQLDMPTVKGWHPSSGIFEAVAHWARCENARRVHAKRPPTAGLTLPVTPSMPAALAQALAVSVPKAGKKKRARKP